MQRNQLDEVKNERNILSKLKKQSNVVSMKASWADKDYLYIMTDFALCGDFSNFLKDHGKYFFLIKDSQVHSIPAWHSTTRLRS